MSRMMVDNASVALEPDLLLAAAGVEAARGAVKLAVANARQAAEFAQTHGQLAREVMSLQTATHFSDRPQWPGWAS